jgi:hypothetical protein
LSFGHLSQKQSTATHVATADKCRRKPEPRAEKVQQYIDILRRGDAPEQHDVAVCTDLDTEGADAALERLAVGRVAGIHVDFRKLPHRGDRDEGARIPEPGAGSDDVHPAVEANTCRTRWDDESARIGELPAKIQAAQEGKQLAKWRALT